MATEENQKAEETQPEENASPSSDQSASPPGGSAETTETTEKEAESKQASEEVSLSKETSPVIGKATSKRKSRLWYLLLALGLTIGGVLAYFWFTNLRMSGQPIKMPEVTPSPVEDQVLKQLEQQGSSDEIEEIEKDLSSTDLSGLDQELTQIEEELSLP